MTETSSVQVRKLMKCILDVRLNDLEALRKLSDQLLIIAGKNQDIYGVAFANLYHFDALFSLGRHEEARLYLVQAQALCEKYSFQNLSMVLHNLAGLYFQDLFDEHLALQHYLKGLDFAQKLHNPIVESRIYNNLGICFRRRNDNSAALLYFNAAYETIEPHICEEVIGTTISFLCNASEIYQVMGQIPESLQTLQRAQALFIDNQYSYFQLKSAWCAHYAVSGEKAKSIAIARELIDEGLSAFEHMHFVSSAYFETFDHMMVIGCQELAFCYLQLLEESCNEQHIGNYYNYKIRKMRYFERYGNEEECDRVYKEFYDTRAKLWSCQA